MILHDVRDQMYALLGETETGVIKIDRAERVIKEVVRELGILLQSADPLTFQDSTEEISWTYTGPVVWSFEYELPADFRQLVLLMRNTLGGTNPMAKREIQVVPFHDWYHYSTIDPGEICYIRHSLSGETVPTFTARFDENGTQITTAQNRYCIGFQGSVTLDASNRNGYFAHYVRTIPEPSGTYAPIVFPEEYSRVLALGAAVRIQVQIGENMSDLKALYDREKSVMVQAVQNRSGVLI